MKKILLSLIATTCLLTAICQKTNYSPAEVKRLADLGRIWGMVHYFHPAMGSGNISTADLIVKNAEALAANPSEENFKRVANQMLSTLKDPATGIFESEKEDSFLLFKTAIQDAAVNRLASGYWYISLPTGAVSNANIMAIPGMMPAEWDSARGIILDLRNAVATTYIDYDFLFDAMPLVQAKLAGNNILPEAFERVAYHNGMVPQENGENSTFYSGWRTITRKTTTAGATTSQAGKVFNKPFAFVINTGTSIDLLKRLLTLRAAGKCLIIFEGSSHDYAAGKITKVAVADGLTMNLRTSDMVFGNNGATPAPDMIINKITDFTENGTYLKQCVELLNKGLPQAQVNNSPLSLQYNIPRFTDTNTGFMVGTGQRLFALYNYWNAIQYFYPYKHLLPKDWNKVLEEHLPKFIQAKDSVEYNFALRTLIAEIHDSHGFFSSPKGTTPVRYEFGSWPSVDVKFIGNRLYVTDVATEMPAQKNIKKWDEIIAIDGLTIEQCLQKWRWYTATSNEATYKRDIAGVLLGGKLNSEVSVKLNRNGTILTEKLVRTGRYMPKENVLNLNPRYPVMKMLDKTTGYVNMGALKTSEVDSMFTLFAQTKTVIMDMRNYPRGTAWSIAPRLTATKKRAVKFRMPTVTADYINGGEEQMSGEFYFDVIPDTSKPTWKGKLILLCNEQTQSQAEYSIMMLQGATDVTVIGSQTAGADGDVTNIILPGNYRTSFSGLEILYPDGGQTQRSGIRINIQSKPTLAGLKAGKDEVLDRALQFIKTGK